MDECGLQLNNESEKVHVISAEEEEITMIACCNADITSIYLIVFLKV